MYRILGKKNGNYLGKKKKVGCLCPVRINFELIFEEMDDQEAVFKEVFGESSDSEGYEYEQQQSSQLEEHDEMLEDRPTPTTFDQNTNWEQIKEIRGLWLCRDFLSPGQQSSLLFSIENGAFHSHPLFFLSFTFSSPFPDFRYIICFGL